MYMRRRRKWKHLRRGKLHIENRLALTIRNANEEDRERTRGHFFMFFFCLDRWTLQGVCRVIQYNVVQKD